MKANRPSHPEHPGPVLIPPRAADAWHVTGIGNGLPGQVTTHITLYRPTMRDDLYIAALEANALNWLICL
jgi:hypothetical protein